MSSDPKPADKRFRVPVPENVKKAGNEIGRLIGKRLPAGWGFGLFLFTYGEKGTMFWISSAERNDMLKALSEWISKEGN